MSNDQEEDAGFQEVKEKKEKEPKKYGHEDPHWTSYRQSPFKGRESLNESNESNESNERNPQNMNLGHVHYGIHSRKKKIPVSFEKI